MMVANTMLLGRIRLGFHLGRFGGLLSAVAAGFRLSVRLLRSSSSLTILFNACRSSQSVLVSRLIRISTE
jgi:hypothetical protein